MLKKLIFALVALSLTSTAFAVIWYVKSWQDLPFSTHQTIPGFEASGAVFDPASSTLFMVGDGWIISSEIFFGTALPLVIKPLSGDLEAVATTNDGYLYVAVEGGAKICVAGVSLFGNKKPEILQLYRTGMQTTGRTWEVAGVPAKCGDGMEGLTWVPDGTHSYGSTTSGGVFYASSQKNGYIYVLDVNRNLSGSTPTTLDSFKPLINEKDISDLYYDPSQEILFVLYDEADRLVQIDISTNSIISNGRLHPLPTAQEGITFLPSCGAQSNGTTKIYLADDTEDNGYYSFDGFHSACPNEANQAEVTYQTTIPTLTTGQLFPVTIKMKNIGTTTWTGNTFKLAPTEGLSTSGSAIGSSVSIPPGAIHTFNINVTAPSTGGLAYFQWRMKEGAKWFGTPTPEVRAIVNDLNLPPPPSCNRPPCEVDF